MEIVAVDIGGTHARFALAEVDGGLVVALGEAVTLKTAEHASFQIAWEAFAALLGRPAPRFAGIAVASPVGGEVIKLTNNPWIIRPALIDERLGLDAHVLVNDFGAVGHAVAQVGSEYMQHICGPDEPLPAEGVISIAGPGTGLGVAHVLRTSDRYFVIESEGGHVDFAPLDSLEDRILAHLRKSFTRVSIERIACGPGLANIHAALAAIDGRPAWIGDATGLWQLAMEGNDSLANAALDRFFLSFGAIAGDIALSQGAHAMVIAGGLGLRLADRFTLSGFAERFVAKGRFEHRMAAMPVKLITHPQPGLYGAAAAFAQENL